MVECSQSRNFRGATLALAIDTCGPTGSVALARFAGEGDSFALLGQKELPGKSYSALLVNSIAELLAESQVQLAHLSALVAVYGPGSFTGVRVGLSTVKGLAEPHCIPVTTISRLAVLGAKAGCGNAALDAHRGEIFLRTANARGEVHEMLAGPAELAALADPAIEVAVCDDAAAALLAAAWPQAALRHTAAPTAADALQAARQQVLASAFVDVALLDGHYLRRPDAEIFAEKPREGAARP